MVVVYLYAEDDSRARGGDEVGYHQWPVYRVAYQSLGYEKRSSEAHQQECRHSDTVCIAGADGVDGLWHIAEYHAYGGYISENIEQIHSYFRV